MLGKVSLYKNGIAAVAGVVRRSEKSQREEQERATEVSKMSVLERASPSGRIGNLEGWEKSGIEEEKMGRRGLSREMKGIAKRQGGKHQELLEPQRKGDHKACKSTVQYCKRQSSRFDCEERGINLMTAVRISEMASVGSSSRG